MRVLLIFGLLIAGSLSAATLHSPSEHLHVLPEGPKVNVLLEKDANSAFLEVKGGYNVIRKDLGSVLSFGGIGKRFVVHALQDGLRWGEEYPDVYQISVIPTYASTCMYVNGIQYKGSVSIYHVRDNRVTVVNEVSIEDYLKSTLAIRYDTPFHPEALSALAIVARTEIYSRAIHGKTMSRPWEITAEETGYYGYGVTLQDNGIQEAVDSTRYMVMESPRYGGPSQNLFLAPDKAEELANLGLNAEKILQTSYPNQSLGITIDADEIALLH